MSSWHVVMVALAGWFDREQQKVIEYLEAFVHGHGSRMVACALAVWLAACGGGGSDTPSVDARGSDGGAGSDAGGGGNCATPAASGKPVLVRPPLDFLDNDLFTPALAVNDQGAGVIAWGENGDGTLRVMAARLEKGCWDAPVEIASENALYGTALIDANGNATVVWSQRHFDQAGVVTASSVWATRYEDGAWQPAQRVSADPPLDATPYVSELAATVDGEGGVVVAWMQGRAEGGLSQGESVGWNRFGPEGWGTPGTITSGINSGDETRIAASGSDLMAIWREGSDDPPGERITHVFSSRWTGTGWAAPELISDPDFGLDGYPDRLHLVSRGAAGFTAVWEQLEGASRSFQLNHYDAAMQAWTGLTSIPPVPAQALSLELAGSETGALAAAWMVVEEPANSAWVARFTPDAGWGEAVQLGADLGEAGPPHVAMDAQGRAQVVWRQPRPDGTSPSVRASRALPTGDWSAPQELESAPGGDPRLASSPAGYTLIGVDVFSVPLGSSNASMSATLFPPDAW